MIIDEEFVYNKYPRTEHDIYLHTLFMCQIADAKINLLMLRDVKTALELVDTILPVCEDVNLGQKDAPVLSRYGFMALQVDQGFQNNIFNSFCRTVSSADFSAITFNELQLRRVRASVIEFALLGNANAQRLIDKLNETFGYDDEFILPIVERRCPNLKRFLNAHEGAGRGINEGDEVSSYKQALKEVKAGGKVTHWIWYIFPQMAGIKGTHSRPALFYGINGRLEAFQYINHPILRKHLVEICQAVLNNKYSVYDIFGDDVIKVRSCILLFASVSDISVFKQIKNKYRW